MNSVPSHSFWTVARRPRMVALLVLLVAVAAVCGRLGVWQVDRAQARAALSAQHAAREAAQGAPDPLARRLAPQSALSGDLVGQRVWAEGVFEPEGELLVADRVAAGRSGYLVLTPFRVDDDGSGGESWRGLSGRPVLAVVRGWVSSTRDVPPAPGGRVRVQGFLQAPEAAGQRATGPGVADSIAPSALVNVWGGPIYSAYVVQSADIASGLRALPRPTVEGGEGINLQNAFYAIQWWLFGAFALALWVRAVRDDAAGGRTRGRTGLLSEMSH